jgi:hypothetical protein
MAAYSRLFKHFRDSLSTGENGRFNQIQIHGTRLFWDKIADYASGSAYC